MFPTTENTATGRAAVKYDLDSLISELNEPKEVINNAPPPGSQPAPGTMQPEPENEQISPEVAALSGKMIAGTIDTVFGTGCSLYAKNSNGEKYQATDKQFSQLSEAWAAVATKYNYKIEDSPVFNVAILSAAVYIPKIQEAKNDRRFAELQQKINEETAAREALEKRVENMEAKK